MSFWLFTKKVVHETEVSNGLDFFTCSLCHGISNLMKSRVGYGTSASWQMVEKRCSIFCKLFRNNGLIAECLHDA